MRHTAKGEGGEEEGEKGREHVLCVGAAEVVSLASSVRPVLAKVSLSTFGPPHPTDSPFRLSVRPRPRP